MLIRGDARRLPIATGTVDTVVTSPPYLEQRRSGADRREIGHDITLAGYVDTIADVFDELRRVLKPDATCRLNLGDKANGSGGSGGDWNGPGVKNSDGLALRFLDRSYPATSFLDVPGAVIRELLHRGWRLRMPIVWHKLTETPESLEHVGRPRWSHEMIFLLAPTSRRHRFHPEALPETGSVWTFRPGGSGPAHLAPFPDELARRCITAATLPGDVVLDPFDGSGTTRRIAESLGRRAIGVDLYPVAGEPVVQPQLGFPL